MYTSVVQVFASSAVVCVLISGCHGFSSSTPPTLLRSGQIASGSPGTAYNGAAQHGVLPSGTSGTGHPGTYHTGLQTTGGTGYNGAAQYGVLPSGTSGTGHSGTYHSGLPTTGVRGYNGAAQHGVLPSGTSGTGHSGTYHTGQQTTGRTGYIRAAQHGVLPSGTSGTGHSGTYHTGLPTTGGTGYNGAAQHGVLLSGTSGTGHSGTYHTGLPTTGGDAPWRLIVGGRYNGMYTNDKPVSSSAGAYQQTHANGQSMVNAYPGGPSSMAYQGTHINGQRVSYSTGILNGLVPFQGYTANVPLGTHPNGQPRTSNAVFQQNPQPFGNILPGLYANKQQGTSYTRPYQTGVRPSAQTGPPRVGSYTNAQSQPSGASPQTSPAGSSTTGTSAPRTSHLPSSQAVMTLTGTPTGRNTQTQQSRIQAAGPRRTAAVQPAASNSTATPRSRSEAYNATRVTAPLQALVAPSAPLLPYALVDPIPYGASRLPGQQAPVQLVGPRHHTVPASPNSLTQLGRAPLPAYVPRPPPQAKLPTAAPVMPDYNPSFTASIGGSMINGPYKSGLFGPLGSVAVPGNQLNTINPSRPTQLGSLPASQLKHTPMMKLIDGRAEVKAAKSLDCKTVASLKGRPGRTDSSMSCDDDTCHGSTSCKMVFDVAFCCPKGVTYSIIHREAQLYKMNILYDN